MSSFFEYYFESNGLHLKYACSAPSVRGRELHDYHEFVFFLGEKARFTSKTIQQDLKVGNVIVIPKNTFHRFDVAEKAYTRCILGFHGNASLQALIQSIGPDTRLIEVPSSSVQTILDGLLEISKVSLPSEEKALYLYASIVRLLFEFKDESRAVKQNINLSRPVQDALVLIDEKYTEDITVSKLAALLHVSESLLAHKFKSEMHISVYRYISQKRLAVAKELIASGTPITVAAVQSGFSDYSCFLRMYKSQYSALPSAASTIITHDYFSSKQDNS